MSDLLERLKAALADRYRVEREIGRGGMATVYLAEDLKHHRHVAVKVLRPELAAVLGGERFLREIALAAKLNHPHILALHDSGETDGFLYYVMPHVEGESLRAKLTREKQLAIDEAVTLTSQVASALDYAHGQGVIHRDIKPENILLHRGEAVVADFGIALAVTAAGGERLTETGLSLGTPEYMSPEQATGSTTLDARSDVYALAAVLYEMVTGEPPQRGATVQAVMAKLLSERPTRPRVVRDSVPEAMDRAIMKALAKVPADRFGSAGELAAALTAEAERPEPDVKSIVVLPFENLSPDPDQEYFSDGLTDEVIADLSKLHALRVISRNSAMQLKGTDKDTKTIGRELNVQYVLEGTVRRAGDRLRITAQLIDAPRDAHIWTEKYDGVLEDVFDMQEQVSRSIVEALEVELSPSERRRLAERPITDVAAHECYVKARAEVWRLTEASLDSAISLLDRGLELVGESDTIYAEKSHALMQHVNIMSRPVETYSALLEEARAFASKALALNPNCGRAEFALGMVCTQSGDPRGACEHFTKAVNLNPSDADSTFMLGFVLAIGGRSLDRARELGETAEQLDPLTPLVRGSQGWVQLFTCEFEAALEGWRAWQHELEQNKSALRVLLVWWHAMNGDYDEATRLVEQMVDDSPKHTATALGSFLMHAVHGDSEKALASLTKQVEEYARWDDGYSYIMADGYALIGELDRASSWLEHAIDYGVCSPYFLEHEPLIENLRSDARFNVCLGRAKRLSESLLD